MEEVDLTLDYTGKSLQLRGGYLGSFFTNDDKVFSNDMQSADHQDFALPLDNQAHQVFLSGGYNITPTTRGTFKAAFTRGIQNEDFYTATTFAGNNRTDLGGLVDTVLLKGGITARPITDLNLRANVRWENKDDQTEIAQYLTTATTRAGFNEVFDRSKLNADVEASYRLPLDLRLTGKVDWERWEREMPDLRQASFRKQTDELTYGAKLSRRMTDTLGASVGYSFANRTGDDYAGTSTSQLVAPIHWGDRDRQKWDLGLDWSPMERLGVQLNYAGTDDQYSGRRLGPQDGSSHFVSLDGTYMLTDAYDLTAYGSFNQTNLKNKQNGSGANAAGANVTAIDWTGDLQHQDVAFGVGVRGTPTKSLKVGADVSYALDRDRYVLESASASLTDLPTVWYRQASFNVFAEYALWDNGSVKLDYGFAYNDTNDWAYSAVSNYYSDDQTTTITTPTSEQVHYIGLSYTHRW